MSPVVIAYQAARKRDPEVKAQEKRCATLRQYGLTPESYAEMERLQGGACRICKRIPNSSLHVDHDHEHGFHRELLCGSCNRAIGLMQENPEALREAADYLEKHHALRPEMI